tara:strand:+ start:1330 stop:1590 length:261 start_codon:yes stop_codon:yes gene_type:complete
MDLVIRVSVLTFVGILIFCIISTIISQRKFRRELKAEMEEIDRRQMERMRVDRENLIIGRGYTRTVNLDDERSLKPYKHIKRHSIR